MKKTPHTYDNWHQLEHVTQYSGRRLKLLFNASSIENGAMGNSEAK